MIGKVWKENSIYLTVVSEGTLEFWSPHVTPVLDKHISPAQCYSHVGFGNMGSSQN